MNVRYLRWGRFVALLPSPQKLALFQPDKLVGEHPVI